MKKRSMMITALILALSLIFATVASALDADVAVVRVGVVA